MVLKLQWPVKIKAAAPSETELGFTGTDIFKGASPTLPGFGVLAHQDYNADLRGNLLYDTVDRMRLSDSIVSGMLKAIKLPLLSAEWDFEPGDDTPEQTEIAEWLTSQLDQMNWSWRTVLRHVLLYLDYGSMPFETVYEVVDDASQNRPMVRLRKLAPRMPRTIADWVVDERGGLAGVVQRTASLGSTKDVNIPIERLLVFVNDLEGANWRGISMLRAAYKDWFYKDRFQRLGGIIMEKRGAGVDVGKLTRGDAATKTAAENVLMGIRTHERAFVLETENFEYRIEGSGGKTLDPLPWVQYYDLSMLRGLLAEFLALGGSEAGSWALSRDKTSFFLMALRAIGQEVVDTFNRHLVRRWCDMNWVGLEAYPKLRHSRLDRRDAAQVIAAIQALIPTGVIDLDPNLKEEIRDLLELPEPEPVTDQPPTPELEPIAPLEPVPVVSRLIKLHESHKSPDGKPTPVPATLLPDKIVASWANGQTAFKNARDASVRILAGLPAGKGGTEARKLLKAIDASEEKHEVLYRGVSLTKEELQALLDNNGMKLGVSSFSKDQTVAGRMGAAASDPRNFYKTGKTETIVIELRNPKKALAIDSHPAMPSRYRYQQEVITYGNFKVVKVEKRNMDFPISWTNWPVTYIIMEPAEEDLKPLREPRQ